MTLCFIFMAIALRFSVFSVANVVLGKDGEGQVSWTDLVRNEEELVQEQRNIMHTVKRRMANWIGHIYRRNCLLKRIIEGR